MNNNLRALHRILTYVLEFVDTLHGNAKTTGNSKRLGLIRTDGIGDFVVWYDCVYVFRELYPDMRVALFCDKNIEELAVETGAFDEVIAVDFSVFTYRNSKKYREAKRMLRKYSCDVLINPMSMRGIAKNCVAAFIPASEKVAIQAWNQRRVPKIQDKVIYDRIVGLPENDYTEIGRNAAFIRELGIKHFKSGFTIFPDTRTGAEITKPYYVLQIDASIEGRCLDVYSISQVIHYIADSSGYKCVITGVDKQKAGILENMLYDVPHVNLVGRTSILDVVHIIKGAAFFIGHDSSGTHIAVMSRIPTVAIVGGWHFGKFLPYNADNNEINSKLHLVYCKMPCFKCYNKFTKECRMSLNCGGQCLCIKKISVTDIIGKVKEVLDYIIPGK